MSGGICKHSVRTLVAHGVALFESTEVGVDRSLGTVFTFYYCKPDYSVFMPPHSINQVFGVRPQQNMLNSRVHILCEGPKEPHFHLLRTSDWLILQNDISLSQTPKPKQSRGIIVCYFQKRQTKAYAPLDSGNHGRLVVREAVPTLTLEGRAAAGSYRDRWTHQRRVF